MESYRQNHVEVARLLQKTEFSFKLMYLIQNCIHLSSSLGVLENMPIYIQWDWKEKTRTFLVVFHFFDDFSAPNLRATMEEVIEFKDKTKKTPYLTWAPSHYELGLFSDVLSCANIINGFNYGQKIRIKILLQNKHDEYYVPDGCRMLVSCDFENGKKKYSYGLIELNATYVNFLKDLFKSIDDDEKIKHVLSSYLRRK